MNKPFLPFVPAAIAFAIVVSCSSPTGSTSGNESPADSSGVAADTTQGNPDGDVFVTPELADQVNGDNESEEKELGPWDDEPMTSVQQAEIDVCGFSADRKYFAFTQVVAGDMIGASGSVFVIDVARNQWASRPAVLDRSEAALEEMKVEFAVTRDSMLRKFNIPYHQSQFTIFNLLESPGIQINGQKYEVVFVNDGGRFDVRVRGNGKEVILQKDSKVPASRGTVRRARAASAYVSGEQIVVFVEYDGDIEVGFENMRYYDRKSIAVTGTIR